MRPDCDAIGSQLALLSACNIGEASLRLERGWSTGGSASGKSDLVIPTVEPQDFDVAIALDTASQQRLGTALGAVRHAEKWINIDHHASNPG